VRLGAYLVDRRPLHIPAFRRLWTASVVTAVGGSFSVVAVPVQLFTITGSSAAVGLAAAASLVALVGSALWSGALADAGDRRRVLLGGQILLGLTYLGLSLQAFALMASVGVLLMLVLAQGVGYGVTLTTMGAVVPRVVPADLLVAANGLSSLSRYVGAIVGPLLAGALIPVLGLGPLYLLDALALGAVLHAVVRLPPIPPTAGPPRRGVVRAVLDGFRYIVGRPILVAILAVDLAAMVFSLPVALFPELATDVYGPHALGPLFAAYPAGVFLAGLVSGTVSRVRRHGAMMAGAAIAWGLCVVGLAVGAHLWVALIALGLGGAVNFVLSTFRNAISQTHTDDALRGRIQGILTVVLIGGPQLANVVHGLAGAVVGPRWAIGLGGALTVTAVGAVLGLAPDLWRYGARPAVDAEQPDRA
jgi:MFS family permease